MESRKRTRTGLLGVTMLAPFLFINIGNVHADTSSPLLSFTGAKEGRVTIEVGKQHLLQIHYETELDWSRFKATADGKDVTSYFHPKPRTAEPIPIPLSVGDNLLEFEAGRYIDKKSDNDSDPESEIYELRVRVIEPVKQVDTIGVRTLAVPPQGNNH